MQSAEVINELLKYGANPSESAFSGNTPFQIASARGMQYIRHLLESSVKGTTVRQKEVRDISRITSPLLSLISLMIKNKRRESTV